MRCSHFSLGGYSRANPSVFFLGAVWVRNAGLQGQGEGALVVGIRSEAARGGGVFALHFHFELLVDV